MCGSLDILNLVWKFLSQREILNISILFGQKRCRTKSPRISQSFSTRSFLRKCSQFSLHFSRTFRVVFRGGKRRPRTISLKNPAIFQCQIPRRTRRKVSQAGKVNPWALGCGGGNFQKDITYLSAGLSLIRFSIWNMCLWVRRACALSVGMLWFLGCTPKGSYGNTLRSKKGFEKVLGRVGKIGSETMSFYSHWKELAP